MSDDLQIKKTKKIELSHQSQLFAKYYCCIIYNYKIVNNIEIERIYKIYLEIKK